MNIVAYKSGPRDFGGGTPGICADGNTTVPLRDSELRWDRTFGFTNPEDLRDQLRGITSGNGNPRAAVEVTTLGILCHGLPGRLAMVPSGTLNTSNISTYGPVLQEINQLLARPRGSRPIVLFLACAAAAPTEGDELFELISGSWMRNTRIIGFRTLLTTDGMSERFLSENMVCLPPDLRVTEDLAVLSGDIRSPGGSWSPEDVRVFQSASPRVHHAREWVNGRLAWQSTARDAAPERGSASRPTQSHQGRGATARSRVQ